MATNTELDLKPYYVYALADPTNDGKIFYVGKGKSIRGNDHLKEARRDLEKSSPKLDQIRRIEEVGEVPIVSVLGRFDSEQEAYAVESTLIHWVYVHENLTNIQVGHGWRHIRPKAQGFSELQGIDIPKRIKISGIAKTGYLRDIINAHQNLGHLDMATDLLGFLKERNLQGLHDEVEAIEGGRYIALSVKVNDVANIVLQLTSATTHRIILNVRPISNRKVDRIVFDKFVDTIPNLRSRAGGSYAKFPHRQGLQLSVGDHEEILRQLLNTTRRLNKSIQAN